MRICEVTHFRKPLEQFLNAVVDGITLNDITKISRKIISPPLTMASYGDGNNQLISSNLIQAFSLVTDTKCYCHVFALQYSMFPVTNPLAGSSMQNEIAFSFSPSQNKSQRIFIADMR